LAYEHQKLGQDGNDDAEAHGIYEHSDGDEDQGMFLMHDMSS
jgi:hypothetical protein